MFQCKGDDDDLKRARRKPAPKVFRRPSVGQVEDRRVELLAMAKSFGIKHRHRMTKPQLIQAIGSHLKKSRTAKAVPMRPKPAPKSTPVRPKENYADLPFSYGETELVLLPVDPFSIFVYWDFSPRNWETVRARRRPVILRVYDVTMIRFNGTNAHSHFDLSVALESQNWYIPLWSAEKSLCAELGWMDQAGKFRPIVRSNVIQTPRAGVSTHTEGRWVEIRWSRRRPSRTTRRRPAGTGPRPELWRPLEAQAAGITSGAAGMFSSRPIGPNPPKKTPV
jgi:uncharacterized protein